MFLLILGFYIISHSCKAEAKLVRHNFEIKYTPGNFDGVRKDKVLTVNGEFPGPTIRAEIGDTVQVKVSNAIQDGQNTSLHWHGIHQRGTPFQDGPSMITQCPLKTGRNQLYEFKVETAGTYWYSYSI
jgi:FtsP/CotA-like multicopper oxidase with cupredoxin domain